MTLPIEESWFVRGMVKATADMWLKGWDERNGGNVSLRVFSEDLDTCRQSLTGDRTVPIGETVAELAGQYFLVTGSGKIFPAMCNLIPEENLGLIEIAPDGKSACILWGPARKWRTNFRVVGTS